MVKRKMKQAPAPWPPYLMAKGTFCSPMAERSAEKCTSQSILYVTTISCRHLKSKMSANT